VYDLGYTNLELLASVEDLAWGYGILRVEYVPMVHGLCADKRKRCLADPSPELNVLLMAVCLQTLLGLEVEELQCAALRLKSYDGLCQVHDGAVGADRSSDDIVCVLQIDDDRFGGGVGLVVDLTHTDVLVGLERLGAVSAFPNSGTRGIGHIRSSAMISMPAVSLVSFLSLLPSRVELGFVGSRTVMLRFVSCKPIVSFPLLRHILPGRHTSVGCATCNGTCRWAIFATDQLLAHRGERART
jgi:hypothetical protein